MINKYPYTDFNEYNMDWIIKTVKDLTVQWAKTHQEWLDVQSEWTNYKNYINNYFANLDVSQEISDKLDAMAADGTLAQLVEPYFVEAFGDIASVVTGWLADNVDPDTGYVIDKSLTIGDAAADAEVVGEQLDLMREIENLIPHPIISTFTQGLGINSSGNTFSSPMRIATEEYIPVNESVIINIQVESGYRVYYAYYNSGKTLISTMGWYTDANKYQTIPANTAYMRICIASVADAVQCTPADSDKALIYGWTHFYRDFYKKSVKYINSLDTNANHIADADDALEPGYYRVPTSNQAANLPSPSGGGTVVVMECLSLISADTQMAQRLMLYFDTVNHNIWGRYASTSNVWRPWYQFNAPYSDIVTKTKWLAVGDSITYGVYSDGGGSHDDPSKGWVTLLANALNYTLQNDGVRGMGYIAEGSNQISFEDDVLPQLETYTGSDYNLVTVALGINDYNTSSISLASLETVIKDSMQRIAAHFPEARIVYITPFNSNRRGTAADNYCYGYAYGGRSLKDIADLIKACADEVGIECIYASQGFLFNNYNMATMLPDDTHPSIEAHKLIAKNMAHLLFY